MSAAASEGGGRRVLDEMSQVYFSTPAPRDEAPLALVPVRNAAGAEGSRFLDNLRANLGERGFPSAAAVAERGSFRLLAGGNGAGGEALDADRFLREVEGKRGVAFLFLRFDGGDDPLARAVTKSGDAGILLVSGEVPSLREGYLFLKGLVRHRCGVDPVVLPVGDAADPWLGIAPLRLAEAAARFLHRKPSVWSEGEQAVSHLVGLLSAIGRRREKGSAEVARRLAGALEDKP